jgi:hypothetical protein
VAEVPAPRLNQKLVTPLPGDHVNVTVELVSVELGAGVVNVAGVGDPEAVYV